MVVSTESFLKPAAACLRNLGSNWPDPVCRLQRAIGSTLKLRSATWQAPLSCVVLWILIVRLHLRCREWRFPHIRGYLRPSVQEPTIASSTASTTLDKGASRLTMANQIDPQSIEDWSTLACSSH
ncbi:hypothetical protein BT67DRAFT_266517 [Trichocladium antarcticum]|uniref:Uncharacterized protein n=1 Tax=Trichocladium antarcticum TaxID=1450529 RepID=A0AAN6UNE0_9PEZI|nr:hypothetical protein BT67DRAFT_266517 [Trichocladium antarcticum]